MVRSYESTVNAPPNGLLEGLRGVLLLRIPAVEGGFRDTVLPVIFPALFDKGGFVSLVAVA